MAERNREVFTAQAEQVRAVAYERFGARVGVLPPMLTDQRDDAIRLHLGL
jgi:hypothetical protein